MRRRAKHLIKEGPLIHTRNDAQNDKVVNIHIFWTFPDLVSVASYIFLYICSGTNIAMNSSHEKL